MKYVIISFSPILSHNHPVQVYQDLDTTNDLYLTFTVLFYLYFQVPVLNNAKPRISHGEVPTCSRIRASWSGKENNASLIHFISQHLHSNLTKVVYMHLKTSFQIFSLDIETRHNI